MNRRVCLFGLSADPPTGHGGHVGIVRALRTTFDDIRVLPVYRHTFREKRRRMASFEHRINMCRLAFEDIATVSDAEYQSWKRAAAARPEYERDQVNVGTASLLEYLQETEPDVTFWFCLGADAFLDLTDGKWKESAQVLHLLQGRIVVLKRQPDSSKVDSTTEQVCDAALLERIEGTPGSKLLSLPSLNEVSSSQVRSTRDERELESMVIPAVLNYMKMHKLYAFA